MQTSSLPKRLPVPFAQNGEKQTIPVASQVGISGGRASYNDGFPVLTRTPINGGGIPPFGTDFNGVLNEITAAVRWQQSGGGYPYDSDFSTTVSGYPNGALIPNSAGSGYWLNTVDANTANPENTTAALTGWVPSENYGVTSITGLSSSSVTLSTLQASKERITLAGTLTSNINLVVPAWIKKWTFVNNCTGSFTVTVKTPSGTGVSIPSGLTASLIGDGTNIIQDSSILGIPGRVYTPPQVFTAVGTYTPTPGTRMIRVMCQGAGGAGGSTPSNASGVAAACSGGAAGAYAEAWFLVSSLTSSISVSPGTAGSPNATTAGGAGGQSLFGSYITCPGGGGGQVIQINSSSTTLLASAESSCNSPSLTGQIITIKSMRGDKGKSGLVVNGSGVAGVGGNSLFGMGGGNTSGGIGNAASGYGSGGGGAFGTSSASAYLGAAGMSGIIVVEEYT